MDKILLKNLKNQNKYTKFFQKWAKQEFKSSPDESKLMENLEVISQNIGMQEGLYIACFDYRNLTLAFFTENVEEIKLISQLSFEHYKVPDPMENVQALADEMAVVGGVKERYEYLLMDTYEDTYVEKVEMGEVVELMEMLTYENAKVIMSSKGLLESEVLKGEKVLN